MLQASQQNGYSQYQAGRAGQDGEEDDNSVAGVTAAGKQQQKENKALRKVPTSNLCEPGAGERHKNELSEYRQASRISSKQPATVSLYK